MKRLGTSSLLGCAVLGLQCDCGTSRRNKIGRKLPLQIWTPCCRIPRDFKTLFWVRYRLKFPPEIHPADATLSRVSREMSKRMLCVFSVWKVRSLQYQLHTTNKKRKLADGLFTEEAEDEHSVAQDWEGYLDKLHTLMIAYSMAGVSAVQGAPAAGGEATLGADSVKFVQAPLDVMLAYFYRAKRTTSLLPVAKRLPWLMMRDAEERAEWVARFRESSSTLGQVVKEVFVARDAHWIPSLQPSGQQAAGGSPNGDRQAGHYFQSIPTRQAHQWQVSR